MGIKPFIKSNLNISFQSQDHCCGKLIVYTKEVWKITNDFKCLHSSLVMQLSHSSFCNLEGLNISSGKNNLGCKSLVAKISLVNTVSFVLAKLLMHKILVNALLVALDPLWYLAILTETHTGIG